MAGCSVKNASGFRWLCLTRSAVALVVTVLAAFVVVQGLLHLLLRPGMIQLNISQSGVFVTRYGTGNYTHYRFRFYLEATNPSELVFLYYNNITVQLVDTSPPSRNNPLAMFDVTPSSISLAQKEEQEYLVYGYARNVSDVAVQKLFKDEKGDKVEGAFMVLSGVVGIDNPKGETRSYPVNFTCGPVAVKSTQLPEPSSGNFKADCLPRSI